jgi:hypothetical protein
MSSVWLVGCEFDATEIPTGAEVVAVTAAAADCLEAQGVRHRLLCELADGRDLAGIEPQLCRLAVELASEVEAYVGAHHAGASFEGPGFLTGQSYYLQYAIGSVAVRTLLARRAIDALDPRQLVTVDAPGGTDQFLLDGYAEAPWTIPLRELAAGRGIEFESITASPAVDGHASSQRTAFLVGAARRAASKLRSRTPKRERRTRTTPSQGLTGICALVIDSPYDWSGVLDALRFAPGTRRFDLAEVQVDVRDWMRAYDPLLREPWTRTAALLPGVPPPVDIPERETLRRLFDRWLAERDVVPRLDVDGIDLWPALARHVRSLTAASPAIARHADAVVEAAVDRTEPDVVCTFAMSSLIAARLSHHCRTRGVPVVCYQHGGAYGTHALVQHELIEFDRADIFLTYGDGVKPRTDVFGAPRAHFVTAGSARLEPERLRRPSRRRRFHNRTEILFVAEVSFANALTTFVVEDTERYRLERESLLTLTANRELHVTYRPFPGQRVTGSIATWLERAGLRAIRVNSSRSLTRLLARSDLVITDTSSPTAWNEALVLGVPLLLYCDPRQTLMAGEFTADLAEACAWCRTPEEFLAALKHLVEDPHTYIEQLRQLDTEPFLRKYVLGPGDRGSVERVLDLLATLPIGGPSFRPTPKR